MSTALVIIATGEVYRRHARELIDSAKKFFVPHDVILFTDDPQSFDVPDVSHKPRLGYPNETLMRYHTMLTKRETLSKYDRIFYSDADNLFVAPVTGEDIFSEGITATAHPGYVGLHGTPETNPRSLAYQPAIRTYFCGGFNGGTSSSFLRMADTISSAISRDLANNIVAVWHDESHMNKYLYDNPPAKVLTPSFCYPHTENGSGYYANIWRQAGLFNVVPKIVTRGAR